MARFGQQVEKVVIVGGGTAGWMTASALAKLLRPAGVSITLVESEAIGTVGVGEATLPHLRFFNQRLGIDENEFITRTEATIKLGIEFCDWGRIGDRYIHPFGDYGRSIGGVGFHHHWLRAFGGPEAQRICDFSLPVVMAEEGRFSPPSDDPESLMSTFSYAYQMDAGLYARFLRSFAERHGVTRTEGRITGHRLDPETGFVTGLRLDGGREVGGDLFVDCSGFRGLLIEGALGAGYEDWSGVLPCDRAVAVPCESTEAPRPYTRATARPAGWHWRIPLQHRVGNGYVYCSDHLSDDEAASDILSGIEGAAIAEPRFLRFTTGRRRKQWSKNVVAVGLSAGFLEPLESTSIYLIQAAITQLVELFPSDGLREEDCAEFDRVLNLEYERVRDFLVLHYHATERDNTPFWNRMRTLSIPDSLAEKMALFRERGYVIQYKDGLFLEPSWLAVYLGQRVLPKAFDPRAVRTDGEKTKAALTGLATEIRSVVNTLPSHSAYLNQAARVAARG
ncbi:tryptophan halogenase family protein [Parvularcula maris]|uniref:Tryptophan 7-halogenase n=1 Tax=Parvularcula maris TaxID=2965077 RepID=A0A9X2LAQ1_9PROT|nr:tryptophan halogenase family protein [Parvularcula maris]MCQ8186101.1 tryptophan 7-halogenase [Parvularcula maris]